MKITLSWLKDHLDTTASLEELCPGLTNLGLVVERVEDPAQKLGAFRVVAVVEATPHPQADRLQVCRVQTGDREIHVVCGAANARAGMKAVLALPGDLIPATGQVLKKGMIRGVESCGMLCSYAELGLEAGDAGEDGIIDLPADVSVGASFIDVLGLADPVIDIDITPNRGDALSVRGIARDLAAAGLGALMLRDGPPPEPFVLRRPEGPSRSMKVTLTPEATPHCPLFASCVIRGVHNGQSPAWLQRRLKAIGQKPISALVDITNYLTFDLGRPLHVFDLDKIQGPLHICLSQGGELFEALDGKTHTLPAGLLVITDNSGVISLAGIMGGATTACTEKTTTVLLESAFFTPEIIRKGGQATGLLSEARTRNERGVDPAFALPGMGEALRLLADFCGGAAEDINVSGALPAPHPPLSLRLEALEKRGGLAVPATQAASILEKLGFAPGIKGDVITVTPPSWRFDIAEEEDLVEEVLRVVGYAHIPPVFLPFRPTARTLHQKRPFKLRRCLAARGFFEVITWSFVSKEKAALFGDVPEALTLLNPISADLSVMRPSLLPHLLDLALSHENRSLPFSPVFEVGPQYAGTRPEDQSLMLTALIPLQPPAAHWQSLPPIDIFQAKAHLFAALEACGVNPVGLQETRAPAGYHPGRSCSFAQGRKTLAFFGEIHPALLRDFNLAGCFGAFEIFLDRLPPPKALFPKPPLSLSPYQPIARDLAFVVDRAIPCEKLTQALRKAGGKTLTAISVFDVFESSTQLGVEKKSVAFRLTFHPQEGTLTEAALAPVLQGMIAEAAKSTGAVLRGAEVAPPPTPKVSG